MDNIHNVDEKPWISKRLLNIKEAISEKDTLLKLNDVALGHGEDDPDENYVHLSDKLRAFEDNNKDELRRYFAFNSTDEKFLTKNPNCTLRTYQRQLEHAITMITERDYKVKYLSSLKTTRKEMLMRYLASFNQSSVGPSRDNNLAQLSPCDKRITAVVVVQIWHQPSKNEKVRLEKEVLFRPDQFLVELRDQFKCQRDYGVPMDLSDDPDQQIERVFRGEMFKSGFFLIENTFYNDFRDPNSTDLSDGIISWSEEEVTIIGEDDRSKRVSRGIGRFKRERMETTKFEDLTIRLGYPYLYCHQGNCEHLFTISDIHYLSLDKLKSNLYPLTSASSIGRKEYSLKCYMCRLRPPHWYTRNNARLPLDPYFFCENCFRSFNFDKNKKKIGNFQAYLYTSALGIPDSVAINTMINKA